MNLKNPDKLTYGELLAYAKLLNNEVQRQEEVTREARKPNAFMVAGQNNEAPRWYSSEEVLLADLKKGQVVEAFTMRKISESFIVKVAEDRIDLFDNRFDAENTAMLHS